MDILAKYDAKATFFVTGRNQDYNYLIKDAYNARYCQGIMSTLTKEVVEKGYQYYDWNGDSTDASGNHVAVDKLIRNGTSCHDNNVMILCHDTQAKDTTVQALPAIIEHYKNLGYTFKGIDDATYAPHQSVNN